jgi:hypothetical protein
VDDLIAKGTFDDLLQAMFDEINTANTNFQNTINGQVNTLTSSLADITSQVEININKYPRLANETDDSPRLNRAVSALSDGDVIKFPKGNYVFNTPIVFNKLICLDGWGMKSTIFTFNHTDGSDCIKYDNGGQVTNVIINKITITGNTNTGHGIRINYGTHLDFKWLTIQNCGGDSIHIEKGWDNTFQKVQCLNNMGNGMYFTATPFVFSEINVNTIEYCSFINNGKINLVAGEETYSYSSEQGAVFNIKNCDFTQGGIGNLQISGLRNVIIDNNYFEIVGSSYPTTGLTPFHIYIGKRSGSGISTAQAVKIRANHFNGMNKTGFSNNAVGYSIILDYAFGVTVEEDNFFYKSVQGSILVTPNTKRITIKPQSIYEDNGIPFLTDNGSETVYLEQQGKDYNVHGTFAGESLLNQGAENFIQNGAFSLINADGSPVGYQLASFTFTKDTDGALICTSNGGSFHKLFYNLPSVRLEHFKGKYIVLCVNVKALVGNTGSYVLYTSDGITEQYTTIPKDGNYNQIYQTRQIASNATSLKIGVGSVTGASYPTSDKIYVKSMRAFLGKAPQAFQYNPTDYPVLSVSSLPSANSNYAGITLRLVGATGVADALYTCLKSSTDTYSWKQGTTG